jgi:hypothetical protein
VDHVGSLTSQGSASAACFARNAADEDDTMANMFEPNSLKYLLSYAAATGKIDTNLNGSILLPNNMHAHVCPMVIIFSPG